MFFTVSDEISISITQSNFSLLFNFSIQRSESSEISAKIILKLTSFKRIYVNSTWWFWHRYLCSFAFGKCCDTNFSGSPRFHLGSVYWLCQLSLVFFQSVSVRVFYQTIGDSSKTRRHLKIPNIGALIATRKGLVSILSSGLSELFSSILSIFRSARISSRSKWQRKSGRCRNTNRMFCQLFSLITAELKFNFKV